MEGMKVSPICVPFRSNVQLSWGFDLRDEEKMQLFLTVAEESNIE